MQVAIWDPAHDGDGRAGAGLFALDRRGQCAADRRGQPAAAAGRRRELAARRLRAGPGRLARPAAGGAPGHPASATRRFPSRVRPRSACWRSARWAPGCAAGGADARGSGARPCQHRRGADGGREEQREAPELVRHAEQVGDGVGASRHRHEDVGPALRRARCCR
ncbi:MAG: hypothetical protein MZW92_56765 [Comamonadaceae bacterium]|nr:hypothetical protein [Comamonadaceae bacterium]